MNIDHGVRNSIYRTGRIALRLRLNRARLTLDSAQVGGGVSVQEGLLDLINVLRGVAHKVSIYTIAF
jgi:hypothetical protein